MDEKFTPGLNPDAAKLDAVHAALQKAMEAARKDGLKVVTGDWGLKKVYDGPGRELGEPGTYEVLRDCLCPMGCVIRGTKAGPGGIYDPESDAGKILGISARSVSNFVVGFDKGELDCGDFDQDEFYFLGRQYRKLVDA